MKILIFASMPIDNNGKISTGSWTIELANNIMKLKGCEVGIVTFSSNRVTLDNVNADIYRVKEKKRIIDRVKKKILLKKYNNYYIKTYTEIIKKFKPDVIHIFGMEENFTLILDHVDIPIILSIQGIYHCINAKLFAGFPVAEIFKNKKFMHFFLMKSLLLQRYFNKQVKKETKVYSKLQNVIGRTDFDRRVSSVLAPNAKYYYCSEFIRSGFFNVKWRNPMNKKSYKLITILGGGIYKGIETLIKASNYLNKIGIKSEWSIIGLNYDNFLWKTLKNQITCKNSITLLGLKTEQEIIDLMCSSNIYVQTSHIENSPNALSEALLLGMPCIASFAGGTNTLIKDNVEGILYQDGDYLSLAGAIKELINDSEKAKILGKNARLAAIKRHDPQKIINDLTSIYTQVINK